ncbi:sigma-54-dependent Fis family transcriptional regulator [bacterium]|nr:sigma-54-dependent Fis family transcriptional regulator [bacterium]
MAHTTRPPRGRLLVADPDPGCRDSLAALLADAGYQVDTADGADAAAAAARADLYDLVLLDAVGRAGGDPRAPIRAVYPDVPVLLMVPYGEVDRAVSETGIDVSGFVAKPARREALLAVVSSALTTRRLSRPAGSRGADPFATLLGTSPQLRAALALARKAAVTDQPVCLLGETGTGKSALAPVVHAASRRSDLPLVKEVLAGRSPGEQLDTLFGHVPGAFTGATGARRGLLQDAHQSTLFLDEVADLSPEVQVSLLRVLDEGTLRPLGSSREIRVDVRLIVATNAPLPGLVEAGKFRRDLFERFGPFVIELPPLRHRTEDIPPLVEHYTQRACRGSRPLWEPEAVRSLTAYHWPGNVRQLKLLIEAAVAMADGRPIGPEHLLFRPGPATAPLGDESALPFETYQDNLRRAYFARAVEKYRSVAEIARHAGLHQTNVRKWLRQYGLVPGD